MEEIAECSHQVTRHYAVNVIEVLVARIMLHRKLTLCMKGGWPDTDFLRLFERRYRVRMQLRIPTKQEAERKQ